ncbi:MAG: protein kinase [Gemmatimonadota bacterium]
MTTQERLTTALADRYRVDRELGAGGMATVYLAHDLKHDRDVAIKVLHSDLGAALGGERFLSEIRTTARLQHPHILPLLDSGDADGLLYYVMPLVTGETLRARLEREHQLPIADALRIAREVADALHHAHALGIIHRDIKPENLLLQGGHALVADFGIALAVQQAGGARMTQTGLSLGTPQYMSPEQAMGEKSLDARSDVYALGAVVYEMLTGQPPFTGPNVQAIVAKVLSSDPEPISAIRKSVPAHVAAAVHTAIEKLPADRYANTADFALALGNPGTTHSSSRAAAGPSADTSRRWRTLALAASGACAAAIATIVWLATRPSPASGPTEYDVVLPDSAAMSLATPFAVSPAGDFVVYPAVADSGRTVLWYRSLLDGAARRITGDGSASTPAISPDGNSLAYVVMREGNVGAAPSGTDNSTPWLERVAMAGGKPTVLARAKSIEEVFWQDAQHVISTEDAGVRARIVDVDAGASAIRSIGYCLNAFLLDDKTSLMCGGGGRKFAGRVLMQPDTTRDARYESFSREGGSALVHGSQFTVVDQRYLVYVAQQGDLLAARLDLATRKVGRPVRLVSGLSLRDYTAAASFALSASGTLVYATGANHAVGHLVRQDERSLDTLPVGRAAFLLWRMSPDGQRLAATVDVLDGQELRVYDLQTGTFDVLVSADDIRQPIWSPTGDRLLYALTRQDGAQDVYVRTLNSTAVPQPLFGAAAFEPSAWLRDGRVFGTDFMSTSLYSVTIEQRPITIDTVMRGVTFAEPSPDGKWIAYMQNDYSSLSLERLPPDGNRYRVFGGADDPHWLSPTELVFRTSEGQRFERTTIAASAENPVGPVRRWLDSARVLGTNGFSSQLSVDGRVIYLQADLEVPVRSLRVVPNWVARMKRAVDEANK